MVATINDHLDYFGATVNQALELVGLAEEGDLIVSQEVAGDPQVAALCQRRGLEAEVLAIEELARYHKPVQRLQIPERQ
jgi:class 3 adenylate cyclase